MRAHLDITTLRVNEGSSRCGIHHDPPAPLPALVAGPTSWMLAPGPCVSHSDWLPSGASRVEKHQEPVLSSTSHLQWRPKHKGGRLYIFDGLWDLSYGPRDVVLLDGRFTHGVSGLRDLPGTNQDSTRAELQRFSLILFSTWQREKMKREKTMRRTGHLAQWQDAWWPSVIWADNFQMHVATDSSLPLKRRRKPMQRYGDHQ